MESLEPRTVPGFLGPRTLLTGNSPFSLAVADLRGDGKEDVVTANYYTNSVSVLLGNGDGTFQAPLNFATGTGPKSVAVADFNGDGKPDIVTANSLSKTVSVLLGNGDGTFQPAQNYAVGNTPTALAVFDLNNDHRPDLVVANFGSGVNAGNNVAVLLGNGDGTFGPAQNFATGNAPVGVAVADFNGDGKPDIVTANSYANPASSLGSVSLLLGNGNGTFQAPVNLAVPKNARAVTVAQLNGDGLPDIVAAYSGGLSVLLNAGGGTFQPAVNLPTHIQGNHPGLAAADFRGDGKIDLVESGEQGVAVLLGNGDGTFGPPHLFVAGPYAPAVVAADLNGDGKPDLVAADLGTQPPYGGVSNLGGITVLLGNGDGTFQANPITPTIAPLISPVLADLNGDGKADMVLAETATNRVTVYLGNGDGTFQAPLVVGTTQALGCLAIADLNGDGKPDLVEGYANVGLKSSMLYASVLLGNGDGTFQAPHKFFLGSVPPGVKVVKIAAADLNGDGKPDLVAVDSYDHAYTLLGNGDGTFGPARSFNTGLGPTSFALADLNGDGSLDLVVTDKNLYAVSVLLGVGDGNFEPAMNFAVGPRPSAVLVADVNGDGRPDLLVANKGGSNSSGYTPGSVSVLLGIGDGTFQPAQNFAAGAGPVGLALADVNGDGRPDLVVADAPYQPGKFVGGLSVLLGNGDGTFQAPVHYSTGFLPGSLAIGDLNGDGRPDAVVTYSSFNAGGFYVFLGNGNPVPSFQLTAPSRVSVGTSFQVTVTALTPTGQVNTAFQGTVSFTDTAHGFMAPPPYTFTPADAGAHTFTLTLAGAGPQALTALVANGSFQTTVSLSVLGISVGDDVTFLSGLYHDLLNHPLDSSSQNFFQPPLDAARDSSLNQAALTLLATQEYQQDLARSFLFRFLPLDSGNSSYLNLFASQLQSVPDEQVIAEILGSQEYFRNQGGTQLSWLTAIYPALLGRTLDQSGQTFFLGELMNGTTLNEVAQQILASQEYKGVIVQADYAKYLGRAASPADLNYWEGQLMAGLTHEQMIAGIVSSAEYVRRVGNTTDLWLTAVFPALLSRPITTLQPSTFINQVYGGVFDSQRQATIANLQSTPEYEGDLVNGYYEKYLGRGVSQADLNNYWYGQFQAGQTYEQIQAQILGSQEYFALNGSSNLTWLQQVYQQVLNRPLDSAGQNYFGGLLANGATQQQVALMILSSSEYQALLIQAAYQAYLGRAASASDVSYWQGQFAGGLTTQAFINQVLQSLEYFRKAHPYP